MSLVSCELALLIPAECSHRSEVLSQPAGLTTLIQVGSCPPAGGPRVFLMAAAGVSKKEGTCVGPPEALLANWWTITSTMFY